MKILVYSAVFHPAVGGIENSTRMLIEEFVRAGHEVKVVTEQVQNPASSLPGIEVVHSSQKGRQIALFQWSDVVYMPNITLKGMWLFMLNPWKKWVISHNDFHLRYASRPIAALKRFLMRWTNRHIAVSRAVAEFVGNDAKVVHCCYDERIFRFDPGVARDLDILFVGRLVSQKGCEMLIEACARLHRPFMLSIVGKGEQQQLLETKVRELGLADRVRFVGVLQGEALARFMNRHRVMVVPSVDVEGFGVVALEGLACGCHMVAANAGGLAQAIGPHGALFPMGDTQRLHRLLEQALDKPAKRTLSAPLIAHLDAHKREQVARRYLHVFS